MNNGQTKIGFDIDGTVADCWRENSILFHRRWFSGTIMAFLLNYSNKHKSVRWFIRRYVSRSQLLMTPTVKAYFITSRPQWLFAATYNWMHRNKINPIAIYMAQRHVPYLEFVERAVEKAWTINGIELDIYYEDEERTRKHLKEFCPHAEILEPKEAIKRGHAVWKEDS